MEIAYPAAPGRHRFMVVSEAADFMDADLAPGKTYYTVVAPRIGMWKARFSLYPRRPDDQKTRDELTFCKWYANTPASYQWAQQNMTEVEALEKEYLAEWLPQESEKPMLNAGDGTTTPVVPTPPQPSNLPAVIHH